MQSRSQKFEPDVSGASHTPIWYSVSNVFFLLVLLTLTTPASAISPTRILFVLSASSNVYTRVTDVVAEETAPWCKTGLIDCPIKSFGLDERSPEDLRAQIIAAAPNLIVTLGRKAALVVSDMKQPAAVLFALIPKSVYHDCCKGAEAAMIGSSAIYLDQPVARQLALVGAALPQRSRIGVLLGPHNRDIAHSFLTTASDLPIEFIFREVSDAGQVGGQLKQLLEEIDVLLAVPDPLVHNRQTVTGLLMASYRAGIPTVAYSAAYVKAGALLGLFSTPDQIGRQVADTIKTFDASGSSRLPPPQYPSYFRVTTNDSVAHSLKIRLPDPSELERKLR